MPAENGLPPYTSKHPTTGLYRYFRRPPTGVAGSVFSRSYGTKDRKTVWSKYPAIHAEAEANFERLRTGRSVSDDYLRAAASAITPGPIGDGRHRLDLDRENFRKVIEHRGGSWLNGLTDTDKDALVTEVMKSYASDGLVLIDEFQKNLNSAAAEARTLVKPPIPKDKLTLMRAFEQAWVPAAKRSPGTLVEIKRYVGEFIALNGDHALADITREHWAAWRAECLDKYGAGGTAFKRFTMIKTIVNEAIKAGLFERKHHTGQDIVMRKPERTKLRNEGWSDDELKILFKSDIFKHPDDPADYWIPAIIAHTGARLAEVANMRARDVGKRHGMMTFYMAREQGKTEESRRIVPIPKTIERLNFYEYQKTVPKKGPLFPDNNARTFTKQFGRFRKKLGLTRRGCDIHAFRHHLKTLLGDMACPDRVNDYITGHAASNVGATYGKTHYLTVLKYLDQIDFGVTVPRWEQT